MHAPSSSKPLDPFAAALAARHEIESRLVVDARDEGELLGTVLSEVREMCATHVDSARIDREGRLGTELLQRVAERGWFGLTVPEQYGGSALSLAAATRVIAELAGANGSLGTCIGLHSGLALHALLHVASPEAKSKYLNEVASGRCIAAFAATEPGAGSDIAAVKTTLVDRGDRLELNGGKCYVTNGGLAGVLTVLAQSPGLGGARAGHTLVLVDAAAHGVSRSGEENKLGLKGSSTVSVYFDGVTVEPIHVLGEFSKGLEYAHNALGWGRTFMAAGCLGSARAALAKAVEHAQTREQFGRPLAKFPLVHEALARARADVLTIESTLRLVCAFGDARVGELTLPSTLLKLIASEQAWRVVDTSLQLMGGAGYMEENGIARSLRDVRITRIFEGANDVLRVSIAAAALTWATQSLSDVPLAASGEFAEEGRLVASELCALGDAINAVRARWGFRLFSQQAVAAQLADAIAESFAAFALLLRASTEEKIPPQLFQLAIRESLGRATRARLAATVERDARVSDIYAAL